MVIPAHTSYSVSKAAIDQVTRHLAVELGPHQIRSNAVKPTVVRTEMGRTAWPEGAPETKDRVRGLGLPEISTIQKPTASGSTATWQEN